MLLRCWAAVFGGHKWIGSDNLATSGYYFVRSGEPLRSDVTFAHVDGWNSPVAQTEENQKIVSTTIQASVTISLNYRNSGQTNNIISHIPSRQPWTWADPNRTHRRLIPTAFPSDPTSSIVVFRFHCFVVTSLVAVSDNYYQLPFFHHYLSVSIRLETTS